jgi:hypothetical protein
MPPPNCPKAWNAGRNAGFPPQENFCDRGRLGFGAVTEQGVAPPVFASMPCLGGRGFSNTEARPVSGLSVTGPGRSGQRQDPARSQQSQLRRRGGRPSQSDRTPALRPCQYRRGLQTAEAGNPNLHSPSMPSRHARMQENSEMPNRPKNKRRC